MIIHHAIGEYIMSHLIKTVLPSSRLNVVWMITFVWELVSEDVTNRPYHEDSRKADILSLNVFKC